MVSQKASQSSWSVSEGLLCGHLSPLEELKGNKKQEVYPNQMIAWYVLQKWKNNKAAQGK